MSGPWDRPSPGDSDDTWPTEDLRDPSTDGTQTDRWSDDDPWGKPSTEAASDWGSWPSSTSPPQESLPDDAELPVSDPWAESWGEDAVEPYAGAGPPAEPESDPATPVVEQPGAWTPYEPRAAEA